MEIGPIPALGRWAEPALITESTIRGYGQPKRQRDRALAAATQSIMATRHQRLCTWLALGRTPVDARTYRSTLMVGKRILWINEASSSHIDGEDEC